MKRFLFRVDGGHRQGMGHLVKSGHLARELTRRGHRVVYVNREDPAARQNLAEAGFEQLTIASEADLSEEIQQVNQVIAQVDPDVLVTDVWRLRAEYFRTLDKGKCRWAAIDLLDFEQTAVDVAINGIACELRNTRETRGRTRYFGGPAYALLDPRCGDLRRTPRRHPEKVRNMVLTFGGSDPLNLSARVLDVLTDWDLDVRLTLVLGSAFQHREEIMRLTKNHPFSPRVLWDVDFLPGLLAAADLALAAGGGGTLYELAATGTPAVVLAQVPHQAENARRFERAGLVRYAGPGWRLEGAGLLSALTALADDVAARREMGRRGQSLVDGAGVARAAQILEGL